MDIIESKDEYNEEMRKIEDEKEKLWKTDDVVCVVYCYVAISSILSAPIFTFLMLDYFRLAKTSLKHRTQRHATVTDCATAIFNPRKWYCLYLLTTKKRLQLQERLRALHERNRCSFGNLKITKFIQKLFLIIMKNIIVLILP